MFPQIKTVMKKKCFGCVAGLVSVAIAVVMGASLYMLDYSLSNGGERRTSDALPPVAGLRDTFVVMPSGERHHALCMPNDSARGRTAIVVHGYKDCCGSLLYLGQMYHDSLGYNVLLPDLHGHGLSDGSDIQMGWKDRLDIRYWVDVAERMFADSIHGPSIVLHGVSMGAATVMCLSGEDNLPESVSCIVEDCGYTSAWDEFSVQMREQFSLPAFPLMYTTSVLCKVKYGWSFGECSPLRQVANCPLPMLFIHGSGDTFVPFSMVEALYAAKPQPKQLWVAAGSRHARSFHDYPSEYTKMVREFIQSVGKE